MRTRFGGEWKEKVLVRVLYLNWEKVQDKLPRI